MTLPMISYQLSKEKLASYDLNCGICYRNFQPTSTLYGHKPESSDHSPHAFHRRCLRKFFKSLAENGTLHEDSFRCFYCDKEFENINLLFSDTQFLALIQKNEERAERADEELEEETWTWIRDKLQSLSLSLGSGVFVGSLAALTPPLSSIFPLAVKVQTLAFASLCIYNMSSSHRERFHQIFGPIFRAEGDDPHEFCLKYFSYLSFFLFAESVSFQIAHDAL